MLKLVVSNEILKVKEPGGNAELDRFHAGEILEHSGSGESVLVMACAADGSTGMLLPLPDGDMYEAKIENFREWRTPYFPGPRLVEVRWKTSGKTVWSSYVPDFNAALAVWRKLELLRPNDFEVEIYAQHQDEITILEDIGYFNMSSPSSKPSA